MSLNKLYQIFNVWVHYSSKSSWDDCYFGKLVLSLTKTQIQTRATFVWSQYHKINKCMQRHIKHKEMHMHHGKCLWRRKGNLWIMLFNHESLLILFSSSVFTLADPRTTHGSACLLLGFRGYTTTSTWQLEGYSFSGISSPPPFYLCNINCLPTVINVRQRPLKPIKICFTCGISGWMLGARWMRHVSADILNYCLTHVGISYNVQVIALWDLQSDKEGH